MWISRKYYNFLKENAEKNIDIECQILTVKSNEKLAVARAMEEYSAALEERDKLRLRVVELEHQLEKISKKKDLRSIEELLHHDFKVYFDGAHAFKKYLIDYCNGAAIYPSEMEQLLIEFLQQFGKVKEVPQE